MERVVLALQSLGIPFQVVPDLDILNDKRRGMHVSEQQSNYETLWNGRRNELYKLLMDYNEGLAELYKRAIDELDSLSSEEMSAATRSTISYYARELLNNLPEFLSEDGVMPQRGQFQESQRQATKRLIGLASESSLPSEVADGQRVLAGDNIAVALHDLMQAHEGGSSVRRQRDSIIALGHVQEDSAVIGLMERARSLLVNHQHVDLKYGDKSNSRSEYIEGFRIVEDILLTRLGSFFETVGELRALMSAVEEAGPDKEPDPGEITKEALLRLGDYQHRRVFYGGIRSPKWMRHLKDMGAFNTGVQGDSANGAFLMWPEGDYLVAMAPVCADDVLDICLEAGESRNPYVQAKSLCAASRLPGEKAMRLHRVALTWSESMRVTPYCFDPHDASVLVVNLFRCASSRNQIKKVEKLLRAFFSPFFNQEVDGSYYLRGEIGAPIPEYCYLEELEFVIRNSGGKCGYLQIRELVEHYERRYCEGRHVGYGSPAVYMSWRPSIALPGSTYPSDYGNYLVDALVRAMRDEADRRPECLCEAYRSQSTLVARVSLHVLSEIVAKLPLATNGDDDILASCEEPIRCFAQNVLDDPELFHKGFDAETVSLVQACLVRPALFDLKDVVASIKAYRSLREEMHTGSFWLQGLTRDESDEMAAGQSFSDEHRLLARLGKAVLPESLARRLDALDTELGALDDEDLAFSGLFHWASLGHESPLACDRLLQMPMDELSSFLRDWRPRSVHDEPSVTGLAYTLQEAVTQNAMRFESLLGEVETLRPIYVRALLRGMSAAIDRGGDVPSNDLSAVCAWVSAKEAEEAAGQPGTTPGLMAYYDACFAAGDLAVRLMRGKATLSAKSWRCLLEAGLSLKGIREPSKEIQLAESFPDDPAAVLINLLMPKGVEILSEIAGLSPFEEVRQEAAGYLGELVSLRHDALAYGALGMVFPPLSVSNPQCAQELLSMVVKTQRLDFQVAFIYPMVKLYGFHHELFCQVRAVLDRVIWSSAMIDSSNSVIPAGVVMELIGQWLYIERELGYMASDDDTFLLWRRNTTADMRRDLLHWACHRASGEKTPAAVVRHAMAYWDEVRDYELRLGEAGELTGAFALAQYPLVETGWLASRLVIEASNDDVSDELFGVRERLVDIARTMPGEAIAVLEYAAGTQAGIERISRLGTPLVQVLACACGSSDEAVVDRARSLMDKLGRCGMINLDVRVREAMEDGEGDESRSSYRIS